MTNITISDSVVAKNVASFSSSNSSFASIELDSLSFDFCETIANLGFNAVEMFGADVGCDFAARL